MEAEIFFKRKCTYSLHSGKDAPPVAP